MEQHQDIQEETTRQIITMQPTVWGQRINMDLKWSTRLIHYRLFIYELFQV